MKTIQKYLPWALLVAFLCVIYYLNHCFCFSSDDCAYGLLSQEPENGIYHRISTLSEVWQTNCADGYRPVVHFFVRLFTGVLDKFWFNLSNTIMFGLLLMGINRLARKTWQLSLSVTPILILVVFVVLAKGESYTWCAGSLNYLWAAVFTLGFCLMREKIEEGKQLRISIISMMPLAIICGWVQESFALPILFALGIWNLIYIKRLSVAKVLVYGCYALGALLLCLRAAGRASTIEAFSIMGCLLTQIKIGAALKGVWLLVLLFLFKRNKREFLKRNQFELLILLGSYLMISIVGFNGERSLWCANLFALVVFVREINPSRWVSLSCGVGLITLCVPVILLGTKIHARFDAFEKTFLSSTDDVTCHERVDCGLFARFFHQVVYLWQDGGHGRAYAHYHGRANSPIALSQELYELLYLTNNFCVPENRLPIEGNFYTTPTTNAIVMPLEENISVTPVADIQYALPKDLLFRVKFEVAIRKSPPVASMKNTRVLVSKAGKAYLLLGKYPECDCYIQKIRLSGENAGRE